MNEQPTTPDAHIADPVDYARPTAAEVNAAFANAYTVAEQKSAELRRYTPPSKQRAGITKNHGQGTPKAKRKQAATSRRRNRKKRS